MGLQDSVNAATAKALGSWFLTLFGLISPIAAFALLLSIIYTGLLIWKLIHDVRRQKRLDELETKLKE